MNPLAGDFPDESEAEVRLLGKKEKVVNYIRDSHLVNADGTKDPSTLEHANIAGTTTYVNLLSLLFVVVKVVLFSYVDCCEGNGYFEKDWYFEKVEFFAKIFACAACHSSRPRAKIKYVREKIIDKYLSGPENLAATEHQTRKGQVIYGKIKYQLRNFQQAQIPNRWQTEKHDELMEKLHLEKNAMTASTSQLQTDTKNLLREKYNLELAMVWIGLLKMTWSMMIFVFQYGWTWKVTKIKTYLLSTTSVFLLKKYLLLSPSNMTPAPQKNGPRAAGYERHRQNEDKNGSMTVHNPRPFPSVVMQSPKSKCFPEALFA